jgi:hypothetical protein
LLQGWVTLHHYQIVVLDQVLFQASSFPNEEIQVTKWHIYCFSYYKTITVLQSLVNAEINNESDLFFICHYHSTSSSHYLFFMDRILKTGKLTEKVLRLFIAIGKDKLYVCESYMWSPRPWYQELASLCLENRNGDATESLKKEWHWVKLMEDVVLFL